MSRLFPFPLLNCKKGNVLTVEAAAGIQSNSESRTWQKLEAFGLSPALNPKLYLQLQDPNTSVVNTSHWKSPLHKWKVVRRHTQRCIPVQEWWVTHKCIWKILLLSFFLDIQSNHFPQNKPFVSFSCALQQCACSCYLWTLGVSSRVIFSVLLLASISAYKESWKKITWKSDYFCVCSTIHFHAFKLNQASW